MTMTFVLTSRERQTSGYSFRALPPLSVVGLGYVGAVSAACFAEMTHTVVGVDLDERKIGLINSGSAPLLEPGLDVLTKQNVDCGRLSATRDLVEAVGCTNITLLCVGTPSAQDGTVDVTALKAVARELGQALATKDEYHLVVVRSTVPVGTTRSLVLPAIEAASGKACGRDFGLCFHPEFLREGVAIADFFSPPKTVIGAFDDQSGRALAPLYGSIDAPLIITSIESAEMVKYVDNTWHAVKVSFANEIGQLCHASNVDGHEVMSIFVQDKKLNLSPYYLRPGFAFGGSCLPKDVRALQAQARRTGVAVPLIDSILQSNEAHIAHAATLVSRSMPARVAFLGATFKPETDDLRESPFVDLIGRTRNEGCAVRVYDENITTAGRHLATAHAKMASAATKAVLQDLPSLLHSDINQLLDWADVVVVCHQTQDINDALARRAERKEMVDLAYLPATLRTGPAYAGACW